MGGHYGPLAASIGPVGVVKVDPDDPRVWFRLGLYTGLSVLLALISVALSLVAILWR